MGLIRIAVFMVATLFICDCVSAASYNAGQCPPKYKVFNLKPECHSDADCLKIGKICCPNQFNTKSCTERGRYRTSNINDNKISERFTRGTGEFCDGVKCQPWEVCRLDALSRALKCVRA